MASGAPIRPSSPGMDTWRPQGDTITYGDAAWAGAAWGLAGHATLHFFAIPLPSLEPLLVVFAPAERLAFGLTQNATPLARWFVLLVSVALFWSLVGVGVRAAAHEIGATIRERRQARAATSGPR